jgi:hypothetical protein
VASDVEQSGGQERRRAEVARRRKGNGREPTTALDKAHPDMGSGDDRRWLAPARSPP